MTTKPRGVIYAGEVIGQNGNPNYRLYLLLEKPDNPLNWKDATTWTTFVGGDLPTRSEQAILYGNLKAEFETRWYWSNTQDANNTDYAWMQNFDNCNQDFYHKSNEYRARAVIRVFDVQCEVEQ